MSAFGAKGAVVFSPTRVRNYRDFCAYDSRYGHAPAVPAQRRSVPSAWGRPSSGRCRSNTPRPTSRSRRATSRASLATCAADMTTSTKGRPTGQTMALPTGRRTVRSTPGWDASACRRRSPSSRNGVGLIVVGAGTTASRARRIWPRRQVSARAREAGTSGRGVHARRTVP